jgi:hypothetical protein
VAKRPSLLLKSEVIVHLIDDDFYRYASWLTSESQDAAIASHLSGCARCRDELVANVFGKRIGASENTTPPDTADRRRDRRIPLHERATMTHLNPPVPERSDVHILDMSAGGLKLHASMCVDPGTIVQIRLRASLVTGEVRYCLPVGSEFHVGVQLTDVFPMTHAYPTERDHRIPC